ncbi:MAG: hypothetical protein KJ706_10400 [Candidatus Omnitrophica bacterium]|nr:hypothetical protein [Candidatus Omnitrophota bacterium]MBU4590185.1 hypothetical protein [Candidatus Omnitrophota bacterium]
MKDAKNVITLLIIIILISIAAGYGAGYFVYQDYKQKTAYFDEHTQLTLNKFSELETNLKELYSNFESSIDENSVERKKVLSRIESMNEDIQEWKEGYNAVVSEIKGTIEEMKVDKLTRMVENLQDDVDEFELAVQDLNLKLDDANGSTVTKQRDGGSVDLGRISVHKNTKPKQ